MYKNIVANITLIIMRLLSKPLCRSVVDEQYKTNIGLWNRNSQEGIIEYQNELKEYRYGVATKFAEKLFFSGHEMTAADNTCEIIAVYNTLISMDDLKPKYGFPELIRYFSESGIVLGGVFGTNPISIRLFFEQEQYKVGELKGDDITEEGLSKISGCFDAFILSAFNVGYNPFSMLHTVFIEKKSRDGFRIHNDYEGGKCYSSLYAAVKGYNDGRCGPIYILGIKKVKKTDKQ